MKTAGAIHARTATASKTKILAGAAFLLALAGCGTAPPPTERPSPITDTDTVEPRTFKTPVTPPEQSKQSAIAIATPPPLVERNEDPKQLFGLDGNRVAILLGPASFVRRDGPAEVWQYRAEACVLDVYLYKEGASLTVAHIDLRKRKKATQAPNSCFAALLKAQE